MLFMACGKKAAFFPLGNLIIVLNKDRASWTCFSCSVEITLFLQVELGTVKQHI